MEIICERLAKNNIISGEYGQINSAEFQYLVLGTDDIASGKKAVENVAPRIYEGCRLKEISVDKHESLYAIYYTVTYENDEFLGETGESDGVTYSFQTTGGSAKIEKPIKRIDYWKSDETKEILKDAGIGWNPATNSNAGYDVTVGIMSESYTKLIDTDDITPTYKRLINNMTGTVNNKAFKGWEPGEVLFTGVSLSGQITGKGSKELPVTFNFMISPNLKDFKLTDKLTVTKKGWLYVWYIYKKIPDATTGKLAPKLLHAYLDQVYRESDFGLLRLGR